MTTLPMESLSIFVNFANFSTFLLCLVLKLPQIIIVTRAKSSKGVSLQGLLLELSGYIVFVTYQLNNDYPVSTYLEYPVLIVQDTTLLLLILHYNGTLRQGFIYSLLFVGAWKLLTWKSWIIDMVFSVSTLISSSSKLAQLQCLWLSRDSTQVSALSWAMSTYTCLARIFTTVMTTSDMQVLLRFLVLTVLNGWVLATVVHYKRGSKKQD